MSNKRRSPPVIVEFRRENAAKLAELFNSFDREGLWPGGFTGGVPFTEKRVLDSFPVRAKSISILISTHRGQYTGICSLHPHYEDAEAAYIGVLGVHPDYLGKGHGKALILRSVQIASEKGLRRVDLHTWAGNLRAVPLYKKCGMFWVPESSVYMQDYIPGLLSFPIAKEFFQKHDWYSSQRRKLELTPDEYKLDEMEAFPYEFSADQDQLRVWVDRYGRGILGVERTLGREHLKIMAKLKNHKVITGIEQTLMIEIVNNTADDFQGSLFLSGYEGLEFTGQPTRSFKVQRNSTTQLTAKFTVNPATEVPDIERKQKAIRANLVMGGQLIPLEIGMRLLPLLEITTHPKSVSVSPGTKGAIQFNIFNNSEAPFTGNIFIVDELSQLSLNKTLVPLKAPPKSFCGFKLGVQVSSDQPTSAIPLKLLPRGEVGDVAVEVKPQLVYVRCLRPGGISASLEDTKFGKAVFVENEHLLTSVRLRGALLFINYKNVGTRLTRERKVLQHGRFEVGPPYGYARPVDFEYEIHRDPERLELLLTGMHPDKPGLKMVRKLTFYSGTSTIQDRVTIHNAHPDTPYKVNVRISTPGWGRRLHHRMVVPLGQVVEHEMVGFPVSESDLPTDPQAYSESWICFQSEALDYCFGQIWSDEKLVKIRVGETVTPEYELGEIQPGQSAETPEFYYVVEQGRWPNVREKWKHLIRKKLDAREPEAKAKPLFHIQLARSIVQGSLKLETKLTATNLRNKRTSGTIELEPPHHWKILPSKIKVDNLTADKPLTTKITVVPPSTAELGTFSGRIRFSAEDQETLFPLDFCVISKALESPVDVEEDEEQGKVIYRLSNGVLRLKSSAEFAGCLYFLGEDEVNQLDTSFPQMKTKVFLENYSGGVRAVYLGETFDFQKSKTHEEQHHAEPIEEEPWKGIQFSHDTQRQDELKGIQTAVSYLTLPSSNVLKVKRTYQNPTSASFDFTGCLWLSPKVGGNFEKNQALLPRGDKVLRCKRAEGVAISGVEPDEGWILVRNEEADLGLAMITGNPSNSTILSLDLGKTLLDLFILSRVQLSPGGSCQLEDYLVLTREQHESVRKLARIIRHG